MNNLRDKAREIQKAGEAERGNFEPTGAPLRLYNYWLKNTGSAKGRAIRDGKRRENFCHFWRVVALWAPFMAFRRGVMKVVDNKVFQAVFFLAVLALTVYAITAMSNWAEFLTGLAIGIGIVLVGVAAYFAGVGIKKVWRSEWNAMAGNVAFVLLCAMFGSYFVFLVVMGVKEWGWTFIACSLGALAAVALLIFVAGTVSDFISGRRALRKAAESERRDSLTYEEYIAERDAAREPGRVSKFFSALGDFLILAFQIVRVKKWKICPMVDINA